MVRWKYVPHWLGLSEIQLVIPRIKPRECLFFLGRGLAQISVKWDKDLSGTLSLLKNIKQCFPEIPPVCLRNETLRLYRNDDALPGSSAFSQPWLIHCCLGLFGLAPSRPGSY